MRVRGFPRIEVTSLQPIIDASGERARVTGHSEAIHRDDEPPSHAEGV